MNNTHTAIISAGFLMIGILFYAWQEEWIIIHIPQFKEATSQQVTEKERIPITFWYAKENQCLSDTREILYSTNQIETLTSLIQNWLALIDEEQLLNKKASLQTVSFSPSENELFISFDRTPFDKHESVHTKWLMIESLLKTLYENDLFQGLVWLFVHHKPINDYHLDFSAPWPATGFFSEEDTERPEQPHIPQKNRTHTIILDPAGDAKNPGRIIDGHFERGITLQCCEKLKALLEENHKNLRVIISRVPGETIEPLQNAAFANRLKADLYLSLHLYQEETTRRSHWHTYYFLSHPTTDFWQASQQKPFLRYNHAHYPYLYKTTSLAQKSYARFKQLPDAKQYEIYEPAGIPFKPLIGIHAPALAFEAGIYTKDDWHRILARIAQIVESLLEDIVL